MNNKIICYLQNLLDDKKEEYDQSQEFNNFSEKDSEKFSNEIKDLEDCIKYANEENDYKQKYESQVNDYKYLLSDFDNFKKRCQKEKMQMILDSSKNIILDILPIIDDLEKSLESFSSSNGKSNYQNDLFNGIKLIHSNMIAMLKKNNCEKINCNIGDDFNVDFHHAIAVEKNNNIESGKISKIFQNGYVLNDKVIRPAMVVTAE